MLIPTPHFPEILVRLSSTVSLPTHFQCRRTFASLDFDSLENGLTGQFSFLDNTGTGS